MFELRSRIINILTFWQCTTRFPNKKICYELFIPIVHLISLFSYRSSFPIARGSTKKLKKIQNLRSLITHAGTPWDKWYRCRGVYVVCRVCEPSEWCLNTVRHRSSSTHNLIHRQSSLNWSHILRCFTSVTFSVICYALTPPLLSFTKSFQCSLFTDFIPLSLSTSELALQAF